MGREPGGSSDGGFVDARTVEKDDVRALGETTAAEVEPAAQGRVENIDGQPEGVATGKEGSQLGLVIGVGAPGTGVEQGQDERSMFVGSRGGERPSDEEDLFGVSRGKFRREGGDDSDARFDGEGAPRFTEATAVDMAGLEMGDHLLGGDDHETVVAVWHETRCMKPLSEQEVLS